MTTGYGHWRAWGAWLLAAAFAVGLAPRAHAACTPTNPAPGGAVICSGNDTNGFLDPDDSLSLTILPGAIVTRSSSDAIRILGTGVRVESDGRVTGTGTRTATDGIDGRASLTVTNRGTISGTGHGIDATTGLTVTNAGTITGRDEGIRSGLGSAIDNAGSIASTAASGIAMGSGSVLNRPGATIRSDTAAAIAVTGAGTSRIENRGTLSGGTGIFGGAGAETVLDTGLIEGRGGRAIDLGAGDDALLLYAGSSLSGTADLGDGADTLGFFGRFTGDFAGGAVLDGGPGDDVIRFDSYRRRDISAFRLDGDVVHLAFGIGADLFALTLRSWEAFDFNGEAASLTELATPPAIVPLPRGAPLLAAALLAAALPSRALARRRASRMFTGGVLLMPAGGADRKDSP